MKSLPSRCAALLLLASCSTAALAHPDTDERGHGRTGTFDCRGEQVGRVLGGLVGGAIGNQVGEGGGRAVATVGGAVVGALIGAEIGRRIDAENEACVMHALEPGADGRRSSPRGTRL
jgi:hypothetical protein